MKRDILFRARRRDTGEWVAGNYFHNVRKGVRHTITEKVANEVHDVYRDSLQLMDSSGEFEDI